MAVCLVPALLTACGRVKTFDVSLPRPVRVVLLDASGPRARPADPWGAANLALAVRAEDVRQFIIATAEAAAEVRTPHPHSAVVSVSGDVWSCISMAETGGVPAPGPTYWTVFGVVRDVIEDYGTPDEQAAIFGMSADYATQLAPVARFAGENGFGGWGELTKRKCGL